MTRVRVRVRVRVDLVARIVRDVGRAVEALTDAVAAVGLVHLVRVRVRVRVTR